MARRATHFNTARKNGDTVIVSGGYEFAPFGLEQERHPSVVTKLKSAYDLLGYDIALCAPNDAAVFSHAGIKPEPTWTGPLAKPELVVKNVQGGTLAFILFPDSGQHDKAMEDEVVRFAAALRKEASHNLIIGVSTWGADREMDFIDRHGEAFDIILGSGQGPGYAGLFLRDNAVLLVRTFTKGRYVHSVTIPELPKPGPKTVWEPQKSISTAAEPLGGNIAADPRISAIFKP